MYIVKKIVVKSTVALVAGVASAIGTRVGLMIWDRCLNDKQGEKTEQSFARRKLKVVK
jgi:hypothetical protein